MGREKVASLLGRESGVGLLVQSGLLLDEVGEIRRCHDKLDVVRLDDGRGVDVVVRLSSRLGRHSHSFGRGEKGRSEDAHPRGLRIEDSVKEVQRGEGRAGRKEGGEPKLYLRSWVTECASEVVNSRWSKP